MIELIVNIIYQIAFAVLFICGYALGSWILYKIKTPKKHFKYENPCGCCTKITSSINSCSKHA